MEQDSTDIIERLESFESRLGVRLCAIFAGWNAETNFLTVRGELRSRLGAELADTVSISAVAYDDRGRVIATDDRTISSDDFFEFDVFEVSLRVPNKPAKVCLFPKKF
jgi:hypothetical protein